jgi:hypothetical protein
MDEKTPMSNSTQNSPKYLKNLEITVTTLKCLGNSISVQCFIFSKQVKFCSKSSLVEMQFQIGEGFTKKN